MSSQKTPAHHGSPSGELPGHFPHRTPTRIHEDPGGVRLGGRPAGLLTEPQGLVLSGVSLTTRKLRPAVGEGQTGVPHPETVPLPQVSEVRSTQGGRLRRISAFMTPVTLRCLGPPSSPLAAVGHQERWAVSCDDERSHPFTGRADPRAVPVAPASGGSDSPDRDHLGGGPPRARCRRTRCPSRTALLGERRPVPARASPRAPPTHTSASARAAHFPEPTSSRDATPVRAHSPPGAPTPSARRIRRGGP